MTHASQRRYREKNREKTRLWMRNYRQRNIERFRENARKYRERAKEARAYCEKKYGSDWRQIVSAFFLGERR